MTPVIRIDPCADEPLVEQIVREIRVVLVGGTLVEGDSLPTVRDLARDLGVHHNTVAEAYRRLADEGWVDLARRRGARVKARPRPRGGQADARERLGRALRDAVTQAQADGLATREIATALNEAGERLPAQDRKGNQTR